MYDTFFGFDNRPFASAPQIDQYFPGTAIESTRLTLGRCIERGEGVGMVVGPSGTGKSLLCLMLADQFRDAFEVALLSSGRLSTRRNLLQVILYELGRPYRKMDEGELRLALVDHLTADVDRPHGMVLLVDEAHALPLRLLDEIRMLTNLARDGEPRVRLVLAGSSLLEERFASPKLDSFNQRLVARCYLESFNRDETQQYIHAQIDTAGGSGEKVFTAEACQNVYQATDGVPRLINQVCDHAMLLAYVNGRRRVEAAQIEEAWADLQQLPTPWNGEGQEADAGQSVIEFGRLDDQGEEADELDEPPPSKPPLRISPETDELEESDEPDELDELDELDESDESDTEIAEPTEQLDQIEQMLADVEEDFQPIGSIKPEVELVFEDPFQEAFEQEEIVGDHYGISRKRRVDHVAEEAAQEEPPPVPQPLDTDHSVRVETEVEAAASSAVEIVSGDLFSAGPSGQSETMSSQGREPVAVMEPSENAVAVLEEEPDAADAALSVAPVRPRQYDRLFAKLRRS